MKKIIYTYYLAEIVFSLGFGLHYASYVIFLKSFNLSYLEINMVNFFFMTGVVLLEVPTGIFADIFSRKKSYQLGVFICAIGHLCYFVSQNFWNFVMSEMIIATGLCFISGSLDAWLISELKLSKQKFSQKKIFSTSNILNTVGQIISGIIGAQLATVDLSLPWLIAALVLTGLGMSIMLLMPDNFTRQGNNYKEHLALYKKYSIKGFLVIKNNRLFLFLTLLGAIGSLAIQPMNMFWQPYFKDQYSLATLGFLWTGIKIFAMLGNWLTSKIPDNKIYTSLFYSYLLTSLPFLLLPIFPAPLLFFLIHEIGRGMESPLRSTFLNQEIKNDDIRATVLSYDSMAKRTGAAIGLVTSGIIADTMGIPHTWFWFALLLFICVLIFLQKIKQPYLT
jgi:DHA3 family tetracycline resistance protein-like MFS transporter